MAACPSGGIQTQDGAIFLKGLNRGVGVVIREEDGAFMAGFLRQIHSYFDALTAIWFSAKEGLVFAYDDWFMLLFWNSMLKRLWT